MMLLENEKLEKNHENMQISAPDNYSKQLDAHFSAAPTSSESKSASSVISVPKALPSTVTNGDRHSLPVRKPLPLSNAPSMIPASSFRPKKVLTVSPPSKAIPIQKRAVVKTTPNLDVKPAFTPTSALLTASSTCHEVMRGDENKSPLNVVNNKLSNASSVDHESCVCDRPPAMVVCKRCGNELYGRVQRICATHPKRICLMDQRECVNSFCRSVHLSEIPSASTHRKC